MRAISNVLPAKLTAHDLMTSLTLSCLFQQVLCVCMCIVFMFSKISYNQLFPVWSGLFFLSHAQGKWAFT